MNTRSFQRAIAFSLGVLLASTSLLKIWSSTRYSDPANQSWIESPPTSVLFAIGEATLGFTLLLGMCPRPSWHLSLIAFSLFAIITAIEAVRGKNSCGCFGAVRVRPIYTTCVDLAAVALLLITGKPSREPGVEDRSSEKMAWHMIFAAGIVASWIAVVAGFWATRPAIALAVGQDFGKAGELVILKPEKWGGQRFSLVGQIDTGSQLASGRWIVLLVHHDCDDCAAAVPRYVAEYGRGGEETQNSEGSSEIEEGNTRLAVIEMPPFGDAADPPPWQLPAIVLSGRLNQSRDWFATTPVAILIKDSIVISARDGEGAESPDPTWWK